MLRLEPVSGLAALLDPVEGGAGRAAAGLLDELRATVEDAMGSFHPHAEQGPLRVTKRRLSDTACCERLTIARLSQPFASGGAGLLVEGMVLSRLAGGGATVAEAAEILAQLGQHHDDDPEEAALLEPAAAQWPALPAGWELAYQANTRAVLAGGRVELVARPDLVLRRNGGAVILELKSRGEPRYRAQELAWYVLVHALRFDAVPAGAGLWTAAPSPGAAAVWHRLVVDEALLRAIASTLLEQLPSLVALAEGRPPSRRPGAWCRYCPEADTCPVADARAVDGRIEAPLVGGGRPGPWWADGDDGCEQAADEPF